MQAGVTMLLGANRSRRRPPLQKAAAVLATAALLLAGGCVVTRLSRPAYEGTVVDAVTQVPLPEVSVTCGSLTTATDAQGRFAAPAITHLELTFPGREAPPLSFAFTLKKTGYCERRFRYFSTFGGGSPRDVWKDRLPLVPLSDGPCPPVDARR